MPSRIAAVTAILLVAACTRATPDPAPFAYRFYLEGQPFTPSVVPVEGTVAQPRAGDLIWVNAHRLVLGEPGAYRFEQERTTPTHDRRLWCTQDEGERVLVALAYVNTVEELRDLNPPDWAALRAVEFDSWDDSWSSMLTHLDPARCLLCFDTFAKLTTLSVLPQALRYLDLEYSHNEDAAGLERLTELRYLQVPGREESVTVAWAMRLPQLRRLGIDGTSIRDLTPLGGHPHLGWIQATSTPIEKLPWSRLPCLQELVAYASGCPDAEAERFRILNPGGHIVTTYRGLLLEAVRGAQRLRIRTGSTCHPCKDDHQVYVSDQPGEIAQLVGLLQTSEHYTGHYVVPGCDQYTLEFRDGNGALLLEVGLLGTRQLRSGRIWNQPAPLADSAREPLHAWLRGRSVRCSD
jgi:hypothetical protein